jgi:thiol-disulfide isomerase/thioredoxin
VCIEEFPLVQRVQKQYGKDQLEVLLISIDRSYSFDKSRLGRANKQAKKIFAKLKIDWTNVFAPGGWDEVTKTFNLSGYGLTLVDGDGIVRGAGIGEAQLKKLMTELYPKESSEKKTPTPAP